MDNHQEFRGLSSSEVAKRVAKGQVNQVERFSTRSIPSILRNNILTVFNALLSGSVLALYFIQAYIDAIFLLTVTLANVVLGISEELRAKWALDAIALLKIRSAKVIRDNKKLTIPINEVVIDDLVAFGPGDQIVADGVLVSSGYVSIDESLLTGEAEGVVKNTGDHLLSGSFCFVGSGVYRVTVVGNAVQVNKMTMLAKSYKMYQTPVQKQINIIVQIFTGIMVLFVFLLLLASFSKNLSMASSILSIVTVIKSLVPEGLILVATLAFALGAVRVAKSQILVQKINAIESMCHVTMLCLDKTGTLGTNRLEFVDIKILSGSEQEVKEWVQVFLGAVTDKNQTIVALAEHFPAISNQALAEVPFSSENKISAVCVQYKGLRHSLWLGAPEALQEKRFSYRHYNLLNDLRHQGLRVLLFAMTDKPFPQKSGLQPLAFLVLSDELRSDIRQTIQFYEMRNVNLKILSGDHPDTVAALAKQVGISAHGRLINGSELDQMDHKQFRKVAYHGQFFGNLNPQQKQEIIKSLQESGEYVAMVGDGVNDVLALKQADVGIALNSGAAAARDIADIILLEDSFTHLPKLSQEGDRILYNIKRIAKLFITKNIYCIFFILFAGFIGLEFPLSPRYITWIDLLTIGIPVTFLTMLTPYIKKQNIKNFFADTVLFALAAGLPISVCALFIYANFSLLQEQGLQYGKSAAVTIIIILNLFIVFKVTRAERSKISFGQRRWLIWFVLTAALCIHLLALYWPLIQELLGLVMLKFTAWLPILLVTLIGIVIMQGLFKRAQLRGND